MTHLPFCTQADIEQRFGHHFVLEMADHDNDGTPDPGVVDAAIDRATAEMAYLLSQRYETDEAATHRLVKHWAVVLAAYYLATMRGNPAPQSLLEQVQMIWAQLERLAKGEYSLTDLPTRADYRPTVSNRTIDRRYRRRTVRIDRQTSTDAPSALRQDWAFDWPTSEGAR